nr:septum formation family protein [Corynebacterium lactis]
MADEMTNPEGHDDARGEERPARRDRSGWGFRALTTAMLVGGAGMAFAVQTGVVTVPGLEMSKTSAINASSAPTTVVDEEVAAFTSAQKGNCLNWNLADDLKVSGFRVVDCKEPHAYEVASRLQMKDAEEYAGQFGPQAQYPTQENLIALQNGVCHTAVTEYLGGKYDGTGRFVSAPIIPPQSQWQKGDRTMLCGIQVVNEDGKTSEIVGQAAGQDQARVFEAGKCVTLDEKGAIEQVSCDEDHLMESTGIINLRDHFGDAVPTDQEQNDLLSDKCVALAQNYLGGDDPLYNSTLVPFWTSLKQEALNSGSRSVNCWLIKDNGAGGFSTLKGHANQTFTIDGAPPVAPPPRNPLREQQSSQAPQAPQAPAAPAAPTQ